MDTRIGGKGETEAVAKPARFAGQPFSETLAFSAMRPSTTSNRLIDI